MPGLSDLFGKGSIGEQFLVWGVFQQIIGAAIGPGVTEISKLVNSAAPVVPLSVTDAASLVARNLIDNGTGTDIANDNGIGNDDFEKLVKAAGSAPALALAVEAFQRQLIGQGGNDPLGVSLEGALTDAGIRPAWHPIIEKLAVQIPTGAEVMNAWLEGQITEGEAHDRWLKAGMDPTWFQTAYDANGQAPTPVQALELLNRGIIPERGTGPTSVSYEQAFLEGPWRNKWLESFIALRYYYPPPRTVTAMYHSGQLTHEQAADYLVKQGLTGALAEAYLSPSKTTTTTTAKTLTESQVVALYKDKVFTRPEAITHLEALKYNAADADYILQLTDVSTAAAALTQGISSVRTLFEAGKITETTAEASLVTLEIPAAQAKEIITTWALTRSVTIKTLTASQIESAWYYELIKADDALAQLQALGYDELDAYLVLAIRNKGPIKGVPRPAGGGGAGAPASQTQPSS